MFAKGKQVQHEYFYWEFHENGGRQAVRMGDWKGVRLNVHQNPDGDIQLFHLGNDPNETKDLQAEQSEIVKKIKNIMLEAHVENADFPLINRKK